jgi:hypothetical protein
LKKEPKNFYSLARVLGIPARAQANEVFFASFFFRKKKTLASLPPPLGPAPASG